MVDPMLRGAMRGYGIGAFVRIGIGSPGWLRARDLVPRSGVSSFKAFREDNSRA
jgi:hypothetical protein